MNLRVPIVAGNWKMNTTPVESLALLESMLPGLIAVPEVERVLCPPFVSLAILAPRLTGTGIGLGAQTMHWEDASAYREIAMRRRCAAHDLAPGGGIFRRDRPDGNAYRRPYP
jgi:hypothetical protein